MKLAVSNIAWPAGSDAEAYELLAQHGIGAIEVAPTRVWPEWREITPASVRAFRRSAADAGLRISSLQSILYQKPELRLFGSEAVREALYAHLCDCADLAAELGAECLVFGSPKNRDRGALSEDDALSAASEFFSRVGKYNAKRGVFLVFEANPPQYGCNFATQSHVAARLVRAVGSDGFRLHLDTACLHLAGERPCAAIAGHTDILRHFHVSEPFLGSFSAPEIQHAKIAADLKQVGYQGWAALEMRASDPPLPALEQAVRYFARTYGQYA